MSEYIDREKIMLETCSDCTRQINLVCKHNEPCEKLIAAFLCEEQEDVVPVVHAKRIKTKKHRWKTYSNGEIDFCAWDSGYCNGPQCLDCGEHFCIHCVEKDGGEEAVKERLEKEDCEQKTVCSVCGRYVPDDAPYCHCGAKMDLTAD